MSDREKLLLQAMQKMIQQMKELQESLNTMSESVDLLVRIETNKIKDQEG